MRLLVRLAWNARGLDSWALRLRLSLGRRAPGVPDVLRGHCHVIVLPEPEYGPTLGRERLVGLMVSSDIPGQLCLPPVRIGYGCRCVPGALVPEAAIDEDRDVHTREHNVSAPAREPGQRVVDAES